MFRDHVDWLLPAAREAHRPRPRRRLPGTLRAGRLLHREAAEGARIRATPASCSSRAARLAVARLQEPVARAAHARDGLPRAPARAEPAPLCAQPGRRLGRAAPALPHRARLGHRRARDRVAADLARCACTATRCCSRSHSRPSCMHGDFPRVQAYLARQRRPRASSPRAASWTIRRASSRSIRGATGPASPMPSAPTCGFENGDARAAHRIGWSSVSQTQLKKLRDGVAPASSACRTRRARPRYRELLQRLIIHWRGERKQRADAHALPPARRAVGRPARDLARAARRRARGNAAGRHHARASSR